MHLVGLTGNIASGKSTVAALLAASGVPIIDADLLAREAVAPGSPALRAIVDRWGPSICAPDGTLDRAALRQRVFSDPPELEALNAIVHPEVGRLRDERIAELRERGVPVAVCDVPLLFEAGLTDTVDTILLVDAPRDLRLDRLVRDRGLDPADAMAMIAAQMPAELKRSRADVVIENDGTPEQLAERVATAWKTLAQASQSP